jgi:hypothetical protein
MQEFYRKSLLALILLVVVDALLATLLIRQSYLTLSLFPTHDLDWRYNRNTDATMNGTSTLRIDESSRDRLRFDFRLTKDAQYPFVFAGIVLNDRHGKELQVDLTKYATATFNAKCSPGKEMVMSISTFDEKVSKPGDFITYRSPSAFFACNAAGVPVTLDLTRFSVAQWWFDIFKLDLQAGPGPTGIQTGPRIEIFIWHQFTQSVLRGFLYGNQRLDIAWARLPLYQCVDRDFIVQRRTICCFIFPRIYPGLDRQPRCEIEEGFAAGRLSAINTGTL